MDLPNSRGTGKVGERPRRRKLDFDYFLLNHALASSFALLPPHAGQISGPANPAWKPIPIGLQGNPPIPLLAN